MKSLSWRLNLAAMCAALMMFGTATPVFAAEEDRGGPADRLERLERRVNEMAERQEQMMRRPGAAPERQAPMAAPFRERFRRQMALSGAPGIGPMTPPLGAPAPANAPAPITPPACVAKLCKDISGLMGLCLLVGIVFNILLAIWIFRDIRKRGEGPASSLPWRCWRGYRRRSSIRSCASAIRRRQADRGWLVPCRRSADYKSALRRDRLCLSLPGQAG